jgi:hypothetical protein
MRNPRLPLSKSVPQKYSGESNLRQDRLEYLPRCCRPVFVVETKVGVTQTLFSEAEHIFYAPETVFSITEKIVGEAPAAFVHPSDRVFRRT